MLPFRRESGNLWGHYLYHLERPSILEEPAEIVAAIRSTPETPRRCVIELASRCRLRGRKPLSALAKTTSGSRVSPCPKADDHTT